MVCDYLIVGAGMFGSVLAQRIASVLKKNVLIIDRRDHIGGNCYSQYDPLTHIEYHKYGTHIFHTDHKEVWDFISCFCSFNGYHHQVLTTYNGKVYQLPINLETINSFYQKNFSPQEAKRFLDIEIRKTKIKNPKNFEEKAISLIGKPLYHAFIRSYTLKQWEKDPRDLPTDIIARLPVRFNYAENYFHNCRWQGIPQEGFSQLFKRMLKSPFIKIKTACDFFTNKKKFKVKKKIIYTGPIDRYFNFVFGPLEWRSVRFEKKVLNLVDFQGTSVMNFADAHVKHTRIHEPKHLHPERENLNKKTIIFYEYSCSNPQEPFYPINSKHNQKLFFKYKKLASCESNIVFGGRLGDYAYYDMDTAILKALECFKKKIYR